jgi:hypothetical protein
LINTNFVPYELNITDQGFPAIIPGLKPWQKAYNKSKFYHEAFATSIAFTPDGAIPMGSSGSGFFWQWKTAANYHPDRYLEFLKDARNRFSQLQHNTEKI